MSDNILNTWVQQGLVFEVLHHIPNIRRVHTMQTKNLPLEQKIPTFRYCPKCGTKLLLCIRMLNPDKKTNE